MEPYKLPAFAENDLVKTSHNMIEVNPFNPLTAEWALRALVDFTLSNARRFYSSMGNPLDGKGLRHTHQGKNIIFRLLGKATAKTVLKKSVQACHSRPWGSAYVSKSLLGDSPLNQFPVGSLPLLSSWRLTLIGACYGPIDNLEAGIGTERRNYAVFWRH